MEKIVASHSMQIINNLCKEIQSLCSWDENIRSIAINCLQESVHRIRAEAERLAPKHETALPKASKGTIPPNINPIVPPSHDMKRPPSRLSPIGPKSARGESKSHFVDIKSRSVSRQTNLNHLKTVYESDNVCTHYQQERHGFIETLRAHSIALKSSALEDGGKSKLSYDNITHEMSVVLPPSALALIGMDIMHKFKVVLITPLESVGLEYPLLFSIASTEQNKHGRSLKTHCTVLEFTAEEYFCYLPKWVCNCNL